MLLTAEETKSLKAQVSATLLKAGFESAKVYNLNSSHGRQWQSAQGGFTVRTIEGILFHDGTSKPTTLRIRRWAKGSNQFSPSRQLHPTVYQTALEAAGFTIELKGKDIFVLGKESK
jgi:hypothetical protein